MLSFNGLCYSYNSDSAEKLYKRTTFMEAFLENLPEDRGDTFHPDGSLKDPKMIENRGNSGEHVKLALDTQALRL